MENKMDDELKLASVPLYCKTYKIPLDADVIGTDDFERWFNWFFEEPDLMEMSFIDLGECEIPH